MTVPKANFDAAFVSDPTSGELIGSASSDWIVFNTNSKAAMTAYDDPYDAVRTVLPFNALGTAPNEANAANLVPVRVPDGASFLDLYHIYQGTADPSQAVIARAYGWFPNPKRPQEKSALPVDYDATNFDSLLGYWVALDDAAASYTHVLTFSNAYATRSAITTGSLKTFRISPRISVFVAGSRYIIVPIAQAGNQTGAGQIIGRFVA